MKLTKPLFYDKFVCTADKCSDNCCIGWEIDIDKAAMERFQRAEGEFGERLRSAIHTGGDCPVFALGAGERCALLREDGLCELILHMGEGSLCDICALHPRFFEWYNGEKDAGLGLCCEEVCRLLFENSAPLRFTECEIDEEWEETCDPSLYEYLKAARAQLISILQDRQHSLGIRLCIAAAYTAELQELLDNGADGYPSAYAAAPSHGWHDGTVPALEALHREMESINAEWDSALSRLCAESEKITAALPDYIAASRDELWRYEHIAVYFVYRYFLKSAFDGEVVSRLGFMLSSLAMIVRMDCLTYLEKGSISEWDRIVNLKLYSKQAEYSDDNRELVCDAIWERDSLSIFNLSALLRDMLA